MIEDTGDKRMRVFRPVHYAVAGAYAVLSSVASVVLNLGVLASALVVGLPIAAVAAFVLLSKGQLGKGGKEFDTTGATTRATMTSPLPPGAVKEIIKGNVRDHERFELLHEDQVELLIKAGVSAFTWGEDIVVRLHPVASGTRIEAECQHKQRTAIVDFGQSRRDLQQVLRGVSSASEQP
ncbi:hypothetical protein [Arthrobacter sp. C9C5]|uniref:hypothetical protein n=1 Tax=Arthrobacter sp. C9C5 TaxID=2735267 RepID=UPI0015857371|nr:hypothetical protein [Arthrobacter sp. C9C5]NUU30138.1 hypothetical protein [Arthrobacter sp. C9C5]